jgi:hypothetical protein
MGRFKAPGKNVVKGGPKLKSPLVGALNEAPPVRSAPKAARTSTAGFKGMKGMK